ncbi:uncharacterized protein LOC9662505 [Selaginella moellendorffii]|uniref:uncharacterized protein LOC9662505 n=1 Tax=Selaginella moellendorffii TaxID=88036 RepID=UPI000D1D124B|nr:uncharacterized protein LOC9662505 [Selaginella moellendorffii]|eukprot:XP_024536953.1 uncharacterized protein LOC9662505 [Selaginella moellendorffii]
MATFSRTRRLLLLLLRRHGAADRSPSAARYVSSTAPRGCGANPKSAPVSPRAASRYGRPGDDGYVDAVVNLLESNRPGPEMESELGVLLSSKPAGYKLTPTTVGRVLNELRDADAALFFFRWASRQHGFHHVTYSWNCLLHAMVRDSKHFEAYAIFKAEFLAQCSPDSFTYSTLVAGFCNAKEIDQALVLVKEMMDSGIAAHVRAHNNLLLALFRAGRVSEGVEHFREMAKTCAPNKFTYGTVIDGLSKAQRMEEALDCLKEMHTTGLMPDVVNCNIVLNGLCKARKIDKAIELFLEMPSMGCEPTIVSYNTVISGLASIDKMDEAYKFFNSMIDNGCEPDVIAFTTLIHGFCKAGQPQVGHMLLNQALKRFRPDVFLYTSVIHGYCKAGDLDTGFKILEEMLAAGCIPDAAAYFVLIDPLCKLGRVDEAYELFERMRKSGCLGDYVTFMTLIEALSNHGKLDEACELYREMIERGYEPYLEVQDSLIFALCKAGKVDEANEIYQTVVAKKVATSRVAYNSLMDGYCKLGRVDDGLKLLLQMVECDNFPDIQTYNILVAGFSRANRLDDALELFKLLSSYGCKPNAATYTTIIQGLYDAQRMEEAKAFFDEACEKGFVQPLETAEATEKSKDATTEDCLPLGSTTTVRYSQHFEKASDLKLLEVDESVVQELLQSRLSIKGGVEEEAVLCTSRTTYALKFVSTSNTMLLVPPGEAGDGGSGGALHVIATAGGHMELVEIAPRIDQLKVLVGSRPYTEDSENETVDGLYSWEDLLDSVQASEEQLKDGLRALAAAEIGGFWRTVDPKYTKGLLEMILVTAIQQDWSLSLLPLEELVAVLEGDGYPAQLVRHCVATFGVEEPSSSSWKLDEKRICLHYARELLSSTGRWKTNEFLEAWQRALPPGMKGELEMLRGEALVTRLGSDSWLHRFSSSSLPTQPDARFAALFKERSKWEWNDLEPYLRDDFQADGEDEAQLGAGVDARVSIAARGVLTSPALTAGASTIFEDMEPAGVVSTDDLPLLNLGQHRSDSVALSTNPEVAHHPQTRSRRRAQDPASDGEIATVTAQHRLPVKTAPFASSSRDFLRTLGMHPGDGVDIAHHRVSCHVSLIEAENGLKRELSNLHVFTGSKNSHPDPQVRLERHRQNHCHCFVQPVGPAEEIHHASVVLDAGSDAILRKHGVEVVLSLLDEPGVDASVEDGEERHSVGFEPGLSLHLLEQGENLVAASLPTISCYQRVPSNEIFARSDGVVKDSLSVLHTSTLAVEVHQRSRHEWISLEPGAVDLCLDLPSSVESCEASTGLERREEGGTVWSAAFALHPREELQSQLRITTVSVAVNDRAPRHHRWSSQAIEDFASVHHGSTLPIRIHQRVEQGRVQALQSLRCSRVELSDPLEALDLHESPVELFAFLGGSQEDLESYLSLPVLCESQDQCCPGHYCVLLHPLEDPESIAYPPTLAVHVDQSVGHENAGFVTALDELRVNSPARFEIPGAAAYLERLQGDGSARAQSVSPHSLLRGMFLWRAAIQRRWIYRSACKLPNADARQVESLLCILESAKPGENVSELLGNKHRKLSHDTFSDVLRRLERTDHAKPFFDWAATRKGFTHTRFTYNALLLAMVRGRRVKEAMEIFKEKMENPDAYTYNTLIRGFCLEKKFPEVFALLKEMERRSIAKNAVTHGIILKALCDSDQVDDALSYFRAVTPKASLDVISYTTVIKGLADSKRIDEACELFEKLKTAGCSPNVVAYTAVIDGLLKAGRIEDGLKNFEDMSGSSCVPTRTTYTVVIDGLCKAQMLPDACKVFEQMVQKGCVPDTITYTTLIDGFSKASKMDEARKLLDVMLTKGPEPTAVTYGSIVHGFCKLDMINEAKEVIAQMRERGCEPGLFIFTSLLSYYLSKGRAEEAYQVLTEMTARGCAPDVILYTSLIDLLFSTGRVPEARHVFDSMIEKGCAPDALTYGTIIQNFSKIGNVEAAGEILELMAKSGVGPDCFAYNSLMDGYVKLERVDQAFGVYDRMVASGIKPNAVTFNVLMHGLFKDGKTDRAFSLFKEMLEKDEVPPTLVSYTILIDGLGKAGRVSEAFSQFQEMIDRGIIPECHTYTSLIYSLAKAGRIPEAKKLVEDMVKLGVNPDVQAYSALITGLIDSSMVDTAWDVFQEMMKRGCAPNEVTYKVLRRGFRAAGRALDLEAVKQHFSQGVAMEAGS